MVTFQQSPLSDLVSRSDERPFICSILFSVVWTGKLDAARVTVLMLHLLLQTLALLGASN